ncbi:MAG: YidC/Oxa1 family membrane protein insertase [Candidatus Saccharimonadales bacterium]
MLRTILLEPLLNALLFLYAIIPGGNFGIAIILLTLAIRLLMWPLVKKQMHHQKAMRELQPEIAKIKKKAKGDKQKESQMMLELFKKKEINPFGSIGLALMQFPVLIALFFVLREVVTGDIAASTYSFIQNFPAISEIIANPETFDPTLFGYFHMAESSIILALFAGAAQFFQGRQITPQSSDPNDKSAQMGATMMKVFPVITVIVASALPSALALYWTVSSGVAVIQQHFVLNSELGLMQTVANLTVNRNNNGEAKIKKAKEIKSPKATKKDSTSSITNTSKNQNSKAKKR